ncbi:hypothetical protein [Nocardioides okcheonensis]|uniref:hypothetical protein n=1 Tax=Nocardioides okcheonensis TaxID=2894081 RepID=UPI001E29EBBE|nr:hypothetical protein [Nocardioides okcheonensis]UFN44703.1 hypothetical protein LN652_00305 [Nocardioides okcheonensis]
MTTTDTGATSTALRELGAFENVIDLYASRNPVQFSLVLELAAPVPAARLAQALAHLQRVHPLLAARVDRTGGRPVFRPASASIPLRCVHEPDWRAAAADEQTSPIDLAGGPLVRAVLLTDAGGDSGAVVLLTFSHQVSDGRGALLAVRDLVAHLEDEHRAPRAVPLDQETLLRQLPPPGRDDRDDREDRDDPGPTGAAQPPAASTRPFDGTPPRVESAELGAVRTARLRAAAREHDATVQGVLCAAAAESLAELTGRTTVRLNVPIDLRSALDLEDDVVNRFTATTVTLGTGAGTTTWDLARDASGQLRAGRRAARATALALASLDPASAAEAEAAMLAATSSDLEITNLGAAGSAPSVVAIWGPTMTTQVQGERILGVVTHGGALRMALTTHDRPRGLAVDIAGRLDRLLDRL